MQIKRYLKFGETFLKKFFKAITRPLPNFLGTICLSSTNCWRLYLYVSLLKIILTNNSVGQSLLFYILA